MRDLQRQERDGVQAAKQALACRREAIHVKEYTSGSRRFCYHRDEICYFFHKQIEPGIPATRRALEASTGVWSRWVHRRPFGQKTEARWLLGSRRRYQGARVLPKRS